MWFDGIRQPNTLYVASVSRGKDSTAMLRAIQFLGFPLDAIVSTDVWFDDETPAELPPMVAFKDEWDRKCLDMFGVPVTRVCAMKKPCSQNGNVERVTQKDSTDRIYMETQKSHDKNSMEFTDSLLEWETGAITSKLMPSQKLTYCDIFYSPMKNKNGKLNGIRSQNVQVERERERENYRIYGFPIQKGNWCLAMLKRSALGLSNEKLSLVQRRTQEGSTTDSQSLKTEGIGVKGSKQVLFHSAPRTRG